MVRELGVVTEEDTEEDREEDHEEDPEKDVKGEGTPKDEVVGWKVVRGRRGKGC